MSGSRRSKRRKLAKSEEVAIYGPDALVNTSKRSPACDQREDEHASHPRSQPLRPSDASLDGRIELDFWGNALRPMTPSEYASRCEDLQPNSERCTCLLALARCKQRCETGEQQGLFNKSPSASLTPISEPNGPVSVSDQTLAALCAIKSTPFEQSFLARLHIDQPASNSDPLFVDWETVSPWMELLSDIREHFALAHPDRDRPSCTPAPIEYCHIQRWHLIQVHRLLSKVFWTGITVADCLQDFPERRTVVALYKRLVVGVAILSSPVEAYITYLAVLPGWENAQIGTNMLYHLIMLNPGKDITLHVSANNPAMMLYNRFGFKAEEFVAGFYDHYIPRDSRASKNAFLLRLRR